VVIVIQAESPVTFGFGFFGSADGASTILSSQQVIILLQRDPVAFYDALGTLLRIISLPLFYLTYSSHIGDFIWTAF
jgi:hypothetical protein